VTSTAEASNNSSTHNSASTHLKYHTLHVQVTSSTAETSDNGSAHSSVSNHTTAILKPGQGGTQYAASLPAATSVMASGDSRNCRAWGMRVSSQL